MNKQKIQEALDVLTAAVAEATDSVTLQWTATQHEMKVLRAICRADISVPTAIIRRDPEMSRVEVREVLQSLAREIDSLDK